MEQKQLHTNSLALKFDEILWPTDFVLCYLEYKGFWDHAHLTDGMQWQKKFKKHIHVYVIAFYILDVFCESECSCR